MPAVASVAGRDIPVARLDERLRRLRRGRYARHVPPDSGRDAVWLARWIVQDLVREHVLEHEVNARIRDSREERRESPTRAEISRLFALVTAGTVVAEPDVRAYYERNLDLYRRPERRVVRHWLLLRGTRTSDDAGERIALCRGDFTGALEDAVFTARVGDVVGPLQSEHGWHGVLLERIEPERTLPYEGVRESIASELLAAARARAFAEWLEQRTRDLAVIEPAYRHPADPLHGEVRHRH